MKTIPLLLSAIIISSATFAQNIIPNGSFENNTATGNTLNLTSGWDTTVISSFEVDGGSMDLITANNCGTASDGNWFVTCSPQGGLWPYMAFSFKLDPPLVAGNQYTLSFDKRFCGPNSSPIDIGISTDSTMLGTVIHTFAAPTTNTWFTETYLFTAPMDAAYLTVNVGVSGGTGTVGLDNFILEEAAVGISEVAVGDVKVFVDAESGMLTITLPANGKRNEIEIYNAQGAIVYHSEIETEQCRVNLSTLPAGIYFAKVFDGEKMVGKKLMIGR